MPAFLSRLLLVLFCTSAFVHAQVNRSWTTPIAPFRIADNLYYVGSQDLASYLVVTPKGNILINANLATSPPQIRASVRSLAFAGVTPRSCSTARRMPITWLARRR